MSGHPDDYKGGYPPQGMAYPPPGQGYPPQGMAYPPPGQGYPPPGQGYPPPGQAYPPPAAGFAPVMMSSPQPYPAGTAYPPHGYDMHTGQPPAYPAMGAPIIVEAPIVAAIQVQPRIVFGPNPQVCVCPHCKKEMKTKTSRYPSVMCWVVFFLLIIFGCWLGCCLIPFCIPAFYAATHRCSHCGKVIGHYST